MKRFIWFIFGFIAGISYLFTFLTGWLFGFGFKNNGPRESYYISHPTYSNYANRRKYHAE